MGQRRENPDPSERRSMIEFLKEYAYYVLIDSPIKNDYNLLAQNWICK